MSSNRKDIKSRIKTVQNTQKVTKSMKLIAIIKLKQLQNLLNLSKEYTKQVSNLIQKSFKQIQKDSLDQSQLTNLIKNNIKPEKAYKLFIIVSSDRGLCGPFNSHLFKSLLHDIPANSPKVKFIVLGNKAINFIQKTYGENSITKKYGNLSLVPDKQLVSEITEFIKTEFLNGKIISAQIYFNSFVSMVKSEIQDHFLLPFNQIIDEFQSINKKQINSVSTNYSETESDIKFEPHLAKTLEVLLPLYIENTIYQALIASRAGELANRVNAMTAATDNANTLISQLTLTYNKARQASITQEISEIVAGAESLV